MGNYDTYMPHNPDYINPREFTLHTVIPDISSANSVGFVTCPWKARILAVYTNIEKAITTGDAVITAKNAGDTVGTITIANSGSAAGTQDSLVPAVLATDNNQVAAAGATLQAISDGGSTVVCRANVTFKMVKLED